MADRTVYSIIRGISLESSKIVLAELSNDDPPELMKTTKWSDWISVPAFIDHYFYHANETLVIFDKACYIASKISSRFDLPHLELRIQDGDHWDLSLYKNNNLVVDFSVKKSYFDADLNDRNPWKFGSYEDFIKIWGRVNRDISRYFIDWTAIDHGFKCYDSDGYAANNYMQIYDFMSAIGIAMPEEDDGYSIIKFKGWKGEYKKQPLYRRVIRKLSVWYKGTYPDVPRLTPEEEEIWKKRIGSIKIIKSKNFKLNE
jgi:hypothetical protein